MEVYSIKNLCSLFLLVTFVLALAGCSDAGAAVSEETVPSNKSSYENTEKVVSNMSADEKVSNIINHPAFKGFGQFLFPTERGMPNEEMRLDGIASLLPYHKILIAYFSSAGNIVTDESARGNVGNGNTKFLAELIHGQVGGDLFFIETVDKYPANYNETIDVAMQEQRNNARPALAAHVENMDDYDVIFLGYPNWWGTLPQAVFTFLDEYDFSGKTVIPFCTHEGSGFGRSTGDLESTLPDVTILEGFAVRGSSARNADEDVKQWLSELNLIQ